MELTEKVNYVSPKDNVQLTIFSMLIIFGSRIGGETVLEYEQEIEHFSDGGINYKVTITTMADEANPKKTNRYCMDHYEGGSGMGPCYRIQKYDKHTNTYRML